MGCGASKLDPNHEAVPPRLRPIFEELRRRSNPTSVRGNTPSKKELLATNKMEFYEDDNSSISRSNHHSSRKSEEKKEELGEPERKRSQLEKNFKAEESFREREEGNGEKMEEKEREKGGKKIKEEDENEEDEEDTISHCPASPSFRVYCSDDLPQDDGRNNAGTKGVEGCRIPERQESVNSNQASVKKPASKEKKGRIFGKVPFIQKGGRSIWNVWGCYAHRSSYNKHLLEKATA